MELLFGLETEYALSELDGTGRLRDPTRAVAAMLEMIPQHVPCLGGLCSSGFFLVNGSRMYCDQMRLEMAGPETITPEDACRYALANDAILADLLGMVRRRLGNANLFLSRSNVCYASGNTAGCHESYAYRHHHREMSRQLIPFLVARQVITGAGGFNNLSWGLEFCVSPRVHHLVRAVSDASTHDRGIFHTRMESLAGNGWQRLHVLAGDALASHLGTWLKMAFTALLIALVDGGHRPGDGVQMVDPVAAIREITADPTCQTRVPIEGRRPMSAIEILRHYLEEIEAAKTPLGLPVWTDTACRRIREVLARLELGTSGVDGTLDWAIKHALFTRFLHRRGRDWEWVGRWNRALNKARQTCIDLTETPWPRMPALKAGGNHPDIKSAVLDRIGQEGFGVDDFNAFQALRAQLLELDVRFTQIGGNGVFDLLDGKGVLDHQINELGDIEQAKVEPPVGSRAYARGNCVREFAKNKERYRCDWTGVWDLQEKKWIDLSEPFQGAAEWSTAEVLEAPPRGSLDRILGQLRQRISW